MNEDILKSNWQVLKGKIKSEWSKLTDDDLGVVENKFEELRSKVQSAYGLTKEKAFEEFEKFKQSTLHLINNVQVNKGEKDMKNQNSQKDSQTITGTTNLANHNKEFSSTNDKAAEQVGRNSQKNSPGTGRSVQQGASSTGARGNNNNNSDTNNDDRETARSPGSSGGSGSATRTSGTQGSSGQKH